MRPIEEEQNIEVLRNYTLWLTDEVKSLSNELLKIKESKISDHQLLLEHKLKDQLSRLQKKFFCSGQETLEKRTDRPVGHEQAKLKVHGEHPHEKRVKEGIHKSTGETPVFEYKMTEPALEKESILRNINEGASAWKEIPGLYQDAREITIYERVYQEVLHRQCKYRLNPKYNGPQKEVIITAPGPAKIRAGSRYSIDFALAVATDKYEYHLPLERQRRKMESHGLNIDVKTLYSLCEVTAEHCNVVRERIRKDIMNDFCAVHLDESPWPIIGSESQSYMWVMSNRKGSYFQFEPTRSGKVAEEMVRDYEGSILTDGFGGYNRLKANPKIRAAHCWSHARREFYERFDDYPGEVTKALEFIDELFRIEGEAIDFETLRELRTTKSKPVADQFYEWLLETKNKFLSSYGISQAIRYCLKFWKELTLFLEDLSVPLSNNDAERALRHVVMGRKNFNGSKTINGADTAASIYTVIESCKKVGLQPSQYLKYLIEAGWRKETILTPFELSMEQIGPNKKIQFPAKDDWKI